MLRQVSKSQIKRSSSRSRRWLTKAHTPTNEMLALKELGILLCDRISKGLPGPQLATGAVSPPLLSPFSLVSMPRAEVIEAARDISMSPPSQETLAGDENHQCWSHILGALAISYARSADVSVVAALVRAAGHLGLRDRWLDEAQMYLLDQQAPTGFFGLLSPELSHLRAQDVLVDDIRLRLTVEVLWAICEMS